MANFTLCFQNDSEGFQSWIIHNHDDFGLQKDFTKRSQVNIDLDKDYRFEIAVNSNHRMSAANLSYTATDHKWTINGLNPNEWSIAQTNHSITIKCASNHSGVYNKPKYTAAQVDYNWSGVAKLKPPIQTTSDDVVLSGHGAFRFDGETIVPDGFECWLLAPLGAGIADSLGQAIESKTKITKLGLKNVGSTDLITVNPIVYGAGEAMPNLVLQPPRDIVIKPGGPHVIGVEETTPLADLWQRVIPFRKTGKVVSVYWAACSVIAGATNPVVLGKT